MTPKEQYEARKVERKARSPQPPLRSQQMDPDQEAFMDMADRFVTAVERIADALEGAK